MTDPVTISVAGTAVVAIGKNIAETIRDSSVDFLIGQAKSLGKEELANRIKGLRSDHKWHAQIRAASERAVKRWMDDYHDHDLTLALARDTQFVDLPSVHQAIATIAKRPFDPIAADALRGKFSAVLPAKFDSARIERGVMAFLDILREELVGIADLRDALKTAADIQTARATQQSAATLDAILQRIEQGPTPTDATLENYLNWVIDQHRYLDPRGTMQTVRQVQVLLEEIYVSLEAEAEPPMGVSDRRVFDNELNELMKRDDLRAEDKEDLRENLLAHYTRNEPHESRGPIELAQIAREKQRVVILGDPGAGKTTLMRYLALRHAQAMKRGEAAMSDLGATRLPLYMRFANYAENRNGRSLADFLPACLRGEDDGDPTLGALIRERLAQGTCLILLDGLDEVIAPNERAEIAAQADALIRAYEDAGNRFVVTSRIAGYRTAPLAGDLLHYTVCEMNEAQIKRFLDGWCHAVERFQTPGLSTDAQNRTAQAEIDGIAQAIEKNPGVRRLAANPLLLRVLALIHRTGARLPQRRIELYRLAVDTLIRDWELARGIPQTALVNEAEANRLLAELAAWMHQSKPAGIATEGEVREQLANVKASFVGKEPDDPEVQNAVNEFLTKIRQHTGLFVERAPRRYGFMHLTFEEYFTARWLVAKPRDAAQRIRSHLHQPRWEEPLLLAIGFYGMEFPDDMSDLVEHAILGKDLGGPSPYEEILHRDLLFALRALGDQDVNVKLRKQIVDSAYELWMDAESVGKYKPLRERLSQIIQTIQGSVAGDDLNNQFVTTLRDENATRYASAASALRNATLTAEAVTVLLSALRDENATRHTSAVSTLSNATFSTKAVTSLLAALRDENATVRASAAFALGNATAQPQVVTALLSTLRDENETVRASAASALSKATTQIEVVTALLSALQDKNATVRASAASALCNATTQPPVLTALLSTLRDADATVRASTASGLANATLSAEAVTSLLSALHDENETVRASTASTLSKATLSAEAVTALLSSLRDKDPTARASAASALGNTTAQPKVVTALLSALHDENVTVRVSAASTLGNATAQPQVVTALLSALRDADSMVRAIATSALGNATAQIDVVTALLSALRDENAPVRASAASALLNATAQPEVVTALLSALHDENAPVRASAALALSKAILTAEAVTALLSALRDEDATVRDIAASVLSHANLSVEAVTALLSALRDEDATVRASAASALGNALARPQVINALLSALRDENATVRASAAHALLNLVRQPTMRIPRDLPKQLVASLNLPGLDEPFYNRPRDSLFDVLMTVAPRPMIK